MKEFYKLIYYDLNLEARAGFLPEIFGRKEETQRLNRIISRRMDNNALIVGPSGIGKTIFVHAWVKQLIGQKKNLRLVQIEAESFYSLGVPGVSLQRYQEALEGLPSCVLFIDNFGSLVHNKPALFQNLSRLLNPVLDRGNIHVVLAMEPHEQKWIENQDPGWPKSFEILNLKNQPLAQQLEILKFHLKKLKSRVAVSESVVESIIKFVERFPSLGQLPDGAIKLLDESLSIARGKLTEAEVQRVVSDKVNVPLNQLQTDELELLKGLKSRINEKVVGQDKAINKIALTIQRAKLGLRNPNRPLGSFLLLGPSGVGKTETAKVLAEQVFGRRESFIRIDMSEFGQEHTVQRLIGAPPGYVGYDSGGGLTNPVTAEPYSLILLDEIEKAHSKVFDIFLQILDDGRLTSGQGETVDFTQTIVMATSNLAVSEIIKGFNESLDINSEVFLKNQIIPALTKVFRPEFLNRFDSIIIFKPLDLDNLLKIAQLEIGKIEERIKKHKIKFAIDSEVLRGQIARFVDHRFGARPVKRFIEETCETLVTKSLLK